MKMIEFDTMRTAFNKTLKRMALIFASKPTCNNSFFTLIRGFIICLVSKVAKKKILTFENFLFYCFLFINKASMDYCEA